MNGGYDRYSYFQTTDYTDDDVMDRTQFPFFGLKLELDRNGLNYLLYPTRGIRQTISAIFVTGNEMYAPGTRSPDQVPEAQRRFAALVRGAVRPRALLSGVQMVLGRIPGAVGRDESSFVHKRVRDQHLFAGFHADSAQPVRVYQGVPQQFVHRTRHYADVRVRPEVLPENSAYAFLPGDNNKVKENIHKRVRYMFNSSLVYQTAFGPVSLTLSKYDVTNKNNWFLTFNFGFTIFNRNGLFY